jgi:hypothetical protein
VSNYRERKTKGQAETTCHECGATLYMYPSQLRIAPKHFCDRDCLGLWRSKQTGPRAAHWQGGELISDRRAYVKMPWHHRADQKGYVARYVIVAELKLGRPLLPGEIVHHRDEDCTNDHPDNLEVLPSQSEHARLHGLNRSRDEMGRMRAARRRAS